MTFEGPDKKTNSQGTLVWPDHISNKTLERMGLAIIERSESEQVLQLYRISVWVKAISCISKLAPLISSEPLKVHFRSLKRQFEAAALEELNSIAITATPSLPLLQALLSGVSDAPRVSCGLKFMDLLETLNAVSGQHVTLLDVHKSCIQSHRRSQLPQYHRRCAQE